MKFFPTLPFRPGEILRFGFWFVLLMALFYAAAIRWIFETPPERAGQFGDMFGALNAIFAGLAFVGLLATIAYQHQEIKDARADAKLLKESIEEMTTAMTAQVIAMGNQARQLSDQNELIRQQNENQRRANYMGALVARLHTQDAKIDREQAKGLNSLGSQALRDQLVHQLDRVLDSNATVGRRSEDEA